jgi:hypothetical protein
VHHADGECARGGGEDSQFHDLGHRGEEHISHQGLQRRKSRYSLSLVPSLAKRGLPTSCRELSVQSARQHIDWRGMPTLHRPARAILFEGFPKQRARKQTASRGGMVRPACAVRNDFGDPR